MTAHADVDYIASFLEAVVGEGGVYEIRRGDGRQSFFDTAHEAAQHALQCAESSQAASDDRIWFGVAPRAPGTTRGRAQDCYTPRVFFADLDDLNEWNHHAVMGLLEEVDLPDPTYIVQSGGGHHLYWRYEGELSKGVWEARQAGIVSMLHKVAERANLPFKVDRACKDVARVLQVPGVPNFKYGPDRLATILEGESSEETYPASMFEPKVYRPEDTGPAPEWWDYELPERLVGTGEQDANIVAFACRRLVRDNASYHDVLSEARQFFCEKETCDPPVPFADVRGRVDRMNRINQARTQAWERERQAHQRDEGPGVVEQEPLGVAEIGAWIAEHLGQRVYNVEGLGLMAYIRRYSRFLGGVHAESLVRSGLLSMAEQLPHHNDALRDFSFGSRFSAVFKEARARATFVSATEVSAAPGIIPIEAGKVVDIADGRVVDRADTPPFFNWKSPAKEDDYNESRVLKKYGAWGDFLASSFPSHEERLYLQRLMHYTAIGGNHERVFILAHGPSSAGKNLFFESVSKALQGEVVCPQKNLVCQSIRDFDTTSQLRLSGYRLVFCDEINRGDHLDTSRVKALTSDAGVKARAAYAQEDSHGSNSFVLALLTNVLPELDEPDEALMNRLHFVSFRVARRHPLYAWRESDDRPVMDLTLKDRIKPADVLAWISAGREGYEEQGIAPPESFLQEARGWFRKVDVVGAWADDMLKWSPGIGTKTKFIDLHRDFQRDMTTQMKLPQFKERLREYFERRDYHVKEGSVDRADGMFDLLYGGEEIV